MAYNHSLQNKRILITCGPTWVPIDPVRVISNISSGELAHRISHQLCRERAKVTLIQGPTTHPLRHVPEKLISFSFFNELVKIITHELKKTKYDIVIHASAVSDYKVRSPLLKKIDSKLAKIDLILVPTIKIIEQIKKINPDVFLVGFKLEPTAQGKELKTHAKTLFTKSKCDLVVVNRAINNFYEGSVLDSSQKILATETSREKMAYRLVSILKERI